MLFFTVYNEVASLYADVNAKKMGFTDIDGEHCSGPCCECCLGQCCKWSGPLATHALGHGLSKLGLTNIGAEERQHVLTRRPASCGLNSHRCRLPHSLATQHSLHGSCPHSP